MISKKILFTTLISGLLLFFTSMSASADPSRGDTNPESSNQSIQTRIDRAEYLIEQYDSQIENLMYDLEEIRAGISRIENEIQATEIELENIENSINEKKDTSDARVKAMYINGIDSYLNVLLDSQSFSDFISKIDTLKKIMEFDTKIMEELNLKRDEIADKKAQLENQNKSLLELEAQNNRKLKELTELKEEQEKLIQSLVVSLPKKATEETFNFVAGSSIGDSIVAFALKFRGVPYVWGGITPNGFDCSGFTKYVFANFGFNLERRSSMQARQGTPVSFANLMPGDLVFFGAPIHHVGIYVGNGMFIHAPRTGDVVKISPMRVMDFNCARRFY